MFRFVRLCLLVFNGGDNSVVRNAKKKERNAEVD